MANNKNIVVITGLILIPVFICSCLIFATLSVSLFGAIRKDNICNSCVTPGKMMVSPSGKFSLEMQNFEGTKTQDKNSYILKIVDMLSNDSIALEGKYSNKHKVYALWDNFDNIWVNDTDTGLYFYEKSTKPSYLGERWNRMSAPNYKTIKKCPPRELMDLSHEVLKNYEECLGK